MNKKSFFGGLAIGLAGILAVGAMGWFTKGFREWKKEKPVIDNPIEDSTTSDEAGAYDENGKNLADGNIHAMPMRLTFTGAKSLASNTSNDVTTNEDGTKEVTVQATLNHAVEMTFDWSVAWKETAGDAATSKPNAAVTEYVTVTPQSDGAATATIKMLQGFFYPVELSCSSREFVGLEKVCDIDCFYSGRMNGDVFHDSTFNPLSLYRESTDILSGYMFNMTDSYPFSLDAQSLVTSISLKSPRVKGSYKVEFVNALVGDGYGFNPLSEGDLTVDYYGIRTPALTFNEDIFKQAFYYDTEKGYTADDFYTYGIALLKGATNKVEIKVTFIYTLDNKKTVELTHTGWNGGVYHWYIDVSSLKGVDIDINGGENIVF